MSGSLNKVQLIGNICADPEIRSTQSGSKIANMRVATSESWRDKSTGEKKQKSEFHTVVCFNEGLCKVIEQYVHKGDKVYIEGQLQTRKWQDQSGNDRYSTEIVLQAFNGTLTMLSSAGGNDRQGGEDRGGGGRSSGGGASRERQEQEFGNGDPNSDIPF